MTTPKRKKLAVPTRAEVAAANKSGCTARTKLARKYGLSGAAANAIGLGAPCGVRKKAKR